MIVKTSWALCNILLEKQIKLRMDCLEPDQMTMLSNVGAVMGRILDHPARKNGET